jgi:hypothetical protein
LTDLRHHDIGVQKEFAENVPVCGLIIAFLNIFDRGYHMLLDTRRHG